MSESIPKIGSKAHIQLYLASKSPRRSELLTQLGLSYEVISQVADESQMSLESGVDYVCRVARLKANLSLGILPSDNEIPVLAADTSVVCQGRIMGKPTGRQEACEMLQCLSGRVHQVLTAVTVKTHMQEQSILSSSKVKFKKITPAEIDAYWDSGEPIGKAGGYAIQGLGALFVEQIEGSYTGIVGLPLFETAALLAKFKLDTETIMRSTHGPS